MEKHYFRIEIDSESKTIFMTGKLRRGEVMPALCAMIKEVEEITGRHRIEIVADAVTMIDLSEYRKQNSN